MQSGAECLRAGGLLLGYARVSTDDQDLTNQRAELHAAGCTRIFAEKITGTRRDRPELARVLDHLRPGDVVTVTRLDRLARSTRDLLDIAERIQAAGAGLRSLAEPWADTTTPAGRMVLTVFAGIAEFERSLIIDRTRNGREAAKARGVKFGPRPTLTPAQIEHARELIDRDGRTVKEAAELLAVHRSTLYRALAPGHGCLLRTRRLVRGRCSCAFVSCGRSAATGDIRGRVRGNCDGEVISEALARNAAPALQLCLKALIGSMRAVRRAGSAAAASAMSTSAVTPISQNESCAVSVP